MIWRLLLAAIVLACGVASFSQSPPPKRIDWSKSCNICDSVLIDDITWRVIKDDGVFVGLAGFYDGSGDYMAAVFVGNLSDDRFDVLPGNASLTTWKTSDDFIKARSPMAVLAPTSPEEIASRLRRRAGWANAFGAIGAAFATQNMTIRSIYGPSVTVTTPDYAARRRAAENAAANSARAAEDARSVMNAAFKGNTLFPGQWNAGNLIFRTKKHDVDLFAIKVADTEYAFLFGPAHK